MSNCEICVLQQAVECEKIKSMNLRSSEKTFEYLGEVYFANENNIRRLFYVAGSVVCNYCKRCEPEKF